MTTTTSTTATALIAPASFSGLERNTKVFLIGCGGTGSAVLSQLHKLHKSLMAIGDYGIDVTVFDPKNVTETNVVRQHFWSDADIGFPKASLAVNRFNQFGGMSWTYRIAKYDPSMCGVPDLVITTVDSAKARIAIGEAFSNGVPNKGLWLDLGNNSDAGNCYIGHINSAKEDGLAPSPFELFGSDWAAIDDSKIVEPSCSAREALEKQNLGINDSMAALCNFMVLAPLFIRGSIPIQGFFLDQKQGCTPINYGLNTWLMFGFEPLMAGS